MNPSSGLAYSNVSWWYKDKSAIPYGRLDDIEPSKSRNVVFIPEDLGLVCVYGQATIDAILSNKPKIRRSHVIGRGRLRC